MWHLIKKKFLRYLRTQKDLVKLTSCKPFSGLFQIKLVNFNLKYPKPETPSFAMQ